MRLSPANIGNFRDPVTGRPTRYNFDPSGKVFPSLAGIDPRTYESKNPDVLASSQPSEMKIVLDTQATRTVDEVAAAKIFAGGRGIRSGPAQNALEVTRIYRRQVGPVRGAAGTVLTGLVLAVVEGKIFVDKKIRREPRPAQVDSSVHPVVEASGWSSPSGHSGGFQGPNELHKRFGTAPAAYLDGVARNGGLARVEGGVHFPDDVARGAQDGVGIAGRVPERIIDWLRVRK